MVLDQFDKDVPRDPNAEACYLGALLICGLEDPALQRRARMLVSGGDFFEQDNRIVFEAAARLIDREEPVDGQTLQADLRRRGTLEEVGGVSFLATLLQAVPSWSHIDKYAADVKAASLRRSAMKIGTALAERMRRPVDEQTAPAVIAATVEQLWQLMRQSRPIDVYSLADILGQFIDAKREGKAAALLTGEPEVDEFAGLFSFGKYTVVAGRPSMGKSTFVRWLLGQWAEKGTRTGLISVEEDRQKIAGNYLAEHTDMENDYVAYHAFTTKNYEEADAVRRAMKNVPWFGCDSAFSINEVSAAFDFLVMQKGCRVVGVDHIHLIGSDEKHENEQREIKEISRRLKELAKQHNVVLVAAAQLSRPDKKIAIPNPPTLLDLRASGAIEEHADAVVLLHREDYYRKGETPTHECELHVEKNRNGRRGVAVLRVDLGHQRFYPAPTRDPFHGNGSHQNDTNF